jgi:hypothetical protein
MEFRLPCCLWRCFHVSACTVLLTESEMEALSTPSVNGAWNQNELVYWFLRANNGSSVSILLSRLTNVCRCGRISALRKALCGY